MAKREILITGGRVVPPVVGGKEFDPKPPAPPPDVPLALVLVAVAADGLSIALTYNQALGASTPSENDYSLGGTPAVLVSVGRSGPTITLATSQPILAGQSVTVSYVPGVNPVRDSVGNNAAALNAQAATNGSAATYTPPTVPVNLKCGYFLIGDDLVDANNWPTRKDIFAAGPPVLTSGSLNAVDGWPTPEGVRKSFSCNGTTSYGRINGLAAMGTGDDPSMEWVILYKKNATTNASNTIASMSSSTPGQTTPKRVLAFTTGGYRVTQQSTVAAFTHNANNQLQQMVRVRWVNNGAGGNDITVWRNEELDPVAGTGVLIPGNGTLSNAVIAQAVNTFTFGAQDNGGTVTNFLHGEIFAIWIRDPNAAPLTDDEALEIHNFMLGAYNTQPLYTAPTPIYLQGNFCQSNGLAQGLATGSVPGLPDTQVKECMRSVNNTAVDPTGLSTLDLRGAVHGAQHHMRRGSFAKPHHFFGVGKGATNAGSDWGGQNGSGPVNSLQGLYSTSLASEVRRNIFMAKARFGGSPSVQWTWWQGENDAAAGSVVANQYNENLGAIALYIRNYINRAFGVSNAHGHVFLLNRTLQTGGGMTQAEVDTINSEINLRASGDANLHVLTAWSALTDPSNIQPDSLHATDAAYLVIAEAVKASVKAVDLTL
jgi:hypothetical protein